MIAKDWWGPDPTNLFAITTLGSEFVVTAAVERLASSPQNQASSRHFWGKAGRPAARSLASMKPRTLAAIGAAMIALAGCDSGSPALSGAQPSASASASGSASGLAAWMEVVRCVRAHGHPDFPDPVEDGLGGWKIPESAGNVKAPACDDLVRKAKQQTNQLEAPSAEDMAKLRQYAKCIREHGVPNFPDPNSEGNFGDNGPVAETPTLRKAEDACQHYLPPRPPKGVSR